jgi:O-antigen ligase
MGVVGVSSTHLKWERVLWACVLVCLPVTSFRYLPFFGDAQVKPLSLLPALPLGLLLLWRCLRTRRFVFWSPALLPLLLFILAAVVASAAGVFLAPPTMYQQEYPTRLLRAWITLGVGVSFLLLPIAMVRDQQDLKFSLRWLFIGLLGHLLWSGIQLIDNYLIGVIFDGQPLSNLVDMIQKSFSMSGVAPSRRVTGLTFEPSWLAAQMTSLYLPWVLAALLSGYNAFRSRRVLFFLTATVILLNLLTYSRSGILIMLVAGVMTLVLSARLLITRLRGMGESRSFSGANKGSARISPLVLRLLIGGALIASLAGGIFLLSRNAYFASLFKPGAESITDYFINAYAGPRLAFSLAGWQIFSAHPWFGVGPGGAGFYIPEALPVWAHYNLSEISILLSPANTVFPNVKNLFLRLLAETGLPGLWCWITFYLAVLASVLRLLGSKRPDLVFTGTAGITIWISVVMLGFSQDSLAIPVIWLPIGFLLGMQAGRHDPPPAES